MNCYICVAKEHDEVDDPDADTEEGVPSQELNVNNFK